MRTIKEFFTWAKKRWSFVVSSLVLAYFLFCNRSKVREIVGVFDKNKELEKDAANGARRIDNGLVNDIIASNAETLQQVGEIKQQHEEGVKQINANRNVYVRELAGKTNDELAEMLKKADES